MTDYVIFKIKCTQDKSVAKIQEELERFGCEIEIADIFHDTFDKGDIPEQFRFKKINLDRKDKGGKWIMK